MSKILILVFVALVVLWLLLGRRRGDSRPGEPQADKPAAKPPLKPQAMLACAHCGVHLPQSDVLAGPDGRPYCSDAHRLAGPR